jgi:hypothetical protein
MRPLASPEVANYLSFRMRAAGYRGPDIFTPRAVMRLARAAGGLTRRINILADKALLAAFTVNVHAVRVRHVNAAIRDSEFAMVTRPAHSAFFAVAGALLVGVAIGTAVQWSPSRPSAAPVSQSTQATKVGSGPDAVPEKPTPSPPERFLEPDQIKRMAGYSAGSHRLLAERIAATHQVLQTSPDGHFAVELFVTDKTDPARMERFLLRARDLVPLEELFVIPMAVGRQYRLRVVLGDFPSLDGALAAEKRLPPKYQSAFRTAPRSFGELRGQI